MSSKDGVLRMFLDVDRVSGRVLSVLPLVGSEGEAEVAFALIERLLSGGPSDGSPIQRGARTEVIRACCAGM